MLRGTVEKAYRFHPLIAQAIRRGDGGVAQVLVTEHIEAVKRAWEAYDRAQEKAPRRTARNRGRRRTAAARSPKPAGRPGTPARLRSPNPET